METKLGVYKRSREIVLTNLNQRPAVLHRGTERKGRVLPFGLRHCSEVPIHGDFLEYSNVSKGKVRERKGKWGVDFVDVQSLLSSLVYVPFREYEGSMCQIQYLLAQHSDYKDDLFHGIEASISYSLISLLSQLN